MLGMFEKFKLVGRICMVVRHEGMRKLVVVEPSEAVVLEVLRFVSEESPERIVHRAYVPGETEEPFEKSFFKPIVPELAVNKIENDGFPGQEVPIDDPDFTRHLLTLVA